MIRTELRMTVREGCSADFERAWRAAAEVAARYPGAGPQAMLRDPGAPLHYTITADWASRADLTRYQDSPDREALSAVLEELRESATKGLFEVVAQVPAASAAGTGEAAARETAVRPAAARGAAAAGAAACETVTRPTAARETAAPENASRRTVPASAPPAPPLIPASRSQEGPAQP